VRDPTGAQGIAQRAHQRLLTDQLGQALRAVPARQDPVQVGGRGRRAAELADVLVAIVRHHQ